MTSILISAGSCNAHKLIQINQWRAKRQLVLKINQFLDLLIPQKHVPVRTWFHEEPWALINGGWASQSGNVWHSFPSNLVHIQVKQTTLNLSVSFLTLGQKKSERVWGKVVSDFWTLLCRYIYIYTLCSVYIFMMWIYWWATKALFLCRENPKIPIPWEPITDSLKRLSSCTWTHYTWPWTSPPA